MKKMFICLMICSALLMAEQPDSSVTKLNVSDMTYYNVVPDDVLNSEGKIKIEKPFAFKQPDDKWFSKDKWMHFTTAYFLTIQSSYTLEKIFFTEAVDSRHISIGISLSFSLGKELYDVYGKKEIFSWKDLFYDVLGTGLGYLTASVIQQ